MAIKCNGEGCTYTKAWAFRGKGFWQGKTKWLCDECYGHSFGENTCRVCELGCWDEDMEDNAETYLCGRCRREEELEIDKAIDADAFPNK